MMKLLLTILLFPCLSFGQIEFFGAASTPTDNGTNTSTTTAVTPPGSMQDGDLVILYAYQRGTATFSISNNGGQSWTSETRHESSTATLSGQIFWCRFDGTWDANPSVSFSAGTNTNVVMIVFRPDVSSSTWELCPANFTSHENLLESFSATSPVNNPNGSLNFTPTQNNTVTLAIFNTQDDNTWNSATGTGWTQITSPSAQFRNTSGQDVSSAYNYFIQSTAASIPQTSLTQATLGNDAGIIGLYIWREVASTPATHRVIMIGKAKNFSTINNNSK